MDNDDAVHNKSLPHRLNRLGHPVVTLIAMAMVFMAVLDGRTRVGMLWAVVMGYAAMATAHLWEDEYRAEVNRGEKSE